VPAAHTLALFAVAALALLAVPGPAVLFVISQSIRHGRRAGIVGVVGLHAGTLVQVAAAAAGISALVVSSATAFSVVKYAGAAYLVYLGIQRLVARSEPLAGDAGETSLARIFRRGVVVEVLNPKTAIFFFAFIPQFVDPARGDVALQTTVLGLTFLALGLVTDSLWALAAGSAAGWLRRRPAVERVERWVTGLFFIGLGAATAFAGSERRR
jgi:threonine/homoserine/homoserine lactone efflux protein